MTRIVLLALLLATGGAIVNVAVAWGCASWSDYGERQFLTARMHWESRERYVDFTAYRGIGLDRLDSGPYYNSIGRSAELAVIPLWSRIGEQEWAMSADGEAMRRRIKEFASGLPLRALYSYELVAYDPFTMVIHFGVVTVRDNLGGPVRVLPMNPLWPGFAINTIFYAAVLWMVFAFPFVMRRRRRIKRGLCPACAYPVGTSPVCTECGKPVVESNERAI